MNNIFKIDIAKLTSSSFYLIFFFILCLLSSYSFIDSTIPLYLLAIISIIFNFKNLSFSRGSLSVLLILSLFLTGYFFINPDLIISFKIIRYYYGFVIFYIFFKLYDFESFNYKKITFYLFLIIVIEVILINLIISPALIQVDFRDTQYFGFYYRPLSFNGNSTATASLLVMIFYYFENILKINFNLKYLFILFICVLLVLSTTGIIIFLTYLILKYIFHDKNKILNLFFLLIFFFLTYILTNSFPANIYGFDDVYYNFDKISFKYVTHVLKLKLIELDFFLRDVSYYMNIDQILFGSSDRIPINDCQNVFITNQDPCFNQYKGIGGDLSIINSLYQVGILGSFLIIILIIFLKDNKININGLYLLFLLSSLHYSAIFMPVGQVFLAFVLQKNLRQNVK